LQALDYYVRLSDLGFLESQRNLDDKFLAGELGFVISGDWMLRMMKASPPRFQVGACVIPGPNIPDSRPSSFLGGEFLAINASSRNQQKAAHFIRFLTSRAPNLRFNTAAGSVTPSNLEAAREILNDANPLTMVFLQQIKFARPSPVHPRWVEMQDIIEDAVQKAIYHKGELSAILDQACRQIEQITNAAQ